MTVTARPTPNGITARPLVIGILNVTPDSFSDGGLYPTADAATERGLQLARAGADWVDVGGESTRPGARRVSAAEELRRVVPVVAALAGQDVRVSVDTLRAEVAEAAVAAGAIVVNDVSGGRADPRMLPAVADLGVVYVVSHWRAHSVVMDRHATYEDVVADVVRELNHQLHEAIKAGIDASRLLADPGLGFAKTGSQSWQLLRRIDAVQALGFPVLVGASRKRLLREILDHAGQRDLDLAGAVLSSLLATRGISALRVHDVAATVTALQVVRRFTGCDDKRSPIKEESWPNHT
ncbi:dihydropteroate synthase [Kribbella sp. ALI-6-A]|uniref:dihydropteroate synthase n=1 Tax=Kribbella sp. ALI-6-A TaxID=1933817 RepID=UPI00097BE77A|nr:dihydropteroate synthase [Kribbella sp. ALI-6-A]ONI78520.1 dihydropteroate synthase [Kribbella sp. ALI-6-A]